jgi:hypothetical protein
MFLQVNQTTQPTVEPVTLAQLKQQCVVDASYTDDDALLTSYGVAARQYAEKYTRRSFFNQSWKLTLDHFPAYIYSGTVNPAIRRDWMYYSGIWNGMTIALPKGNVISVDSVGYVDLSGTPQTLAKTQYVVDLNSTPCRIVPTPGIYWPLNTLYIPGSVSVNYTSGSYVQQFTEPITVPTQPPYTCTPQQTPVTKIVSVVDGNGNSVSYTLSNSVLTLSSAQAGQTLTLTYYAGTTLPLPIAQAILLLASHWYQNRQSSSAVGLKEIPFGVAALLDMYTVNIVDYEAVV